MAQNNHAWSQTEGREEFDKFRMIQDKSYESDFDKAIKKMKNKKD